MQVRRPRPPDSSGTRCERGYRSIMSAAEGPCFARRPSRLPAREYSSCSHRGPSCACSPTSRSRVLPCTWQVSFLCLSGPPPPSLRCQKRPLVSGRRRCNVVERIPSCPPSRFASGRRIRGRSWVVKVDGEAAAASTACAGTFAHPPLAAPRNSHPPCLWALTFVSWRKEVCRSVPLGDGKLLARRKGGGRRGAESAIWRHRRPGG